MLTFFVDYTKLKGAEMAEMRTDTGTWVGKDGVHHVFSDCPKRTQRSGMVASTATRLSEVCPTCIEKLKGTLDVYEGEFLT